MAYTPSDKFAKWAKKEGYRARSAHKLLDIQKKFKVLKPGYFVLDLGSAPGSWLQVVSSIIGKKGRVIGIDILMIEKLPGANIETVQKSVLDGDIEEYALKRAGRKFNAVLSDLAPATTGIKERDQIYAHALSYRAFDIASKVLAKNGNAVIKVFEGPDTLLLIKDMEHNFASVKMLKPAGSQKGSKEHFIVARKFKG